MEGFWEGDDGAALFPLSPSALRVLLRAEFAVIGRSTLLEVCKQQKPNQESALL